MNTVDIFDRPVVYIDIETSGGRVNDSRITEIGAIRVDSGETSEFHSLVNPGRPLPYWITKITGLSDDDLVNAPYFEDIAYELHEILEGAIFIAHNVRFDYGFIKHELNQAGFKFSPKLLCTVRLSRALYAEHKGHSLEKIITRHNIRVNNRHRAMDDALAMMDFVRIAYEEKGQVAFNEAISRQFKSKSMPPNIEATAIESINNKPGVYVFEDEEGKPIYVGKSKQIKTRVKSHFANDINSHKEMKLSQATRKIKTIETNTELEALLLESKLIKQLLPLQNRQLRRTSTNYLIMKNTNNSGYDELQVTQKDVAEVADLNSIYGLFTSQKKAKSLLETWRKTFNLCPKLMGLEKTDKACFMYQLKKCKGACIGQEDQTRYNLRVTLAAQRTRMESWKYDHPVLISTTDGTKVVVDKWVVLGYVNSEDNSLNTVEKVFDIDSYKILTSFIRRNIGNIQISPYYIN
ncbi:MAG TPA: exonuclease domain-containing protein [Candidatus Saccharimonadales bacterium]|nr:exonuclease domain-containing protein [Candidatus Saccharimonadales bacterium]